MPWSHTRARSRHYGRDHRTTRDAHMQALRLAGSGRCAEKVCVMRSRLITPDMDLHLCHDPTGTVVLGLGHRQCNLHEAAVRARRKQGRNSGRAHTARTRAARQSRLTW